MSPHRPPPPPSPSKPDLLAPPRILTIPHADVAADVAQIFANNRVSSNSSPPSKKYSTAFHKLSEIVPIIPNTPTFTHTNPPWTPYLYTLWHPIIAKSQRINESIIFSIPGFLFEDLMRCHASWITSGHVTSEILDDVVETWCSTQSGKELNQLLTDSEVKQWFIRLDQMSPKDSAYHPGPITNLRECIMKLTTSMRVYGALHREKEDAEREGRDVQIKAVLNPWNDDMDPGYEYRVFVPPPSAWNFSDDDEFSSNPNYINLKISAISQYKWPSPLQLPLGWTVSQLTQFVHVYSGKILREIVTDAQTSSEMRDLGVMEMLVKYGFTFDVALNVRRLEEGKKEEDGCDVMLVEINPFGALSGCGACLFNWVRDARVLYGLEGVVVFAVTQ